MDSERVRYQFKQLVLKVIDNRRAYNVGGTFNLVHLAKKLSKEN
jgi:hypothetical protein